MGSERPRVVGRYALFDQLGAGGMGGVYLAVLQDGTSTTPLAAKQLHAEHARDPARVVMLLDEFRLTRLARHPNVVPVLDFAYDGEQMLVVMEYVHGQTLRRLLTAERKRGGRVPLRIVAAVFRDVLSGLHAAHEARDVDGSALGIVHRDVTPENVLVGANGLTRLTDFGVAKAAGRLQATQGGGLRGKLSYLAPEQVGGEVTARTDVYAAGLVLWEVLAGRRAIEGGNEAERLVRVLEPAIPPVSSVSSHVPPALDDVVARALAIAEGDRYASAADFANALISTLGESNVATQEEVAAWVRELAGGELEDRERRVAEVLAIGQSLTTGGLGAATTAAPIHLQAAPLPTHEGSPGRSRRVALVAAIAALALANLGLASVLVKKNTSLEPAANAASQTPVLPAPLAMTATTSAASSRSSSAPSASPVSGSKSAEPSSARAGKKVTTHPGARVAGCDPPYVIDSRGIKVYNQDCFR